METEEQRSRNAWNLEHRELRRGVVSEHQAEEVIGWWTAQAWQF